MTDNMQSAAKSRALKSGIGSILMISVTLGSYGSFSNYLLPLSTEFGVGIGQITLIYTIAGLAGLFASLIFSSWVKAMSVRVIVMLNGLFFAVMYILMFFSKSLGLIYAGAVMHGIATTVAAFLVAQTVITWWFAKGAVKWMSYLSVGVGLGTMGISPVLAKCIATFGMRTTALFHGCIGGAIVVLIGATLLSDHPSKYGLQPYGYEEPKEGAAAGASAAGASMTMKQMMSTPAFWLIAASCLLISMAQSGFTNNASAVYQSLGNTAATAALVISIYSAAKMVWSIVFGQFSEKKGIAMGIIVFGAIAVVAFLCGTVLSGFAGALSIALLMGSLTFAGMLGTVAFTKVFGRKNAALAVSIGQAAMSVGAMIGAPVAGFIYDATNTYVAYMLVGAVTVALSVVAVNVAMKKKYD